jgi:hypothetical protein
LQPALAGNRESIAEEWRGDVVQPAQFEGRAHGVEITRAEEDANVSAHEKPDS